MKIAVLAGGIGSERDISLESGQAVYNALQGSCDPIMSDINPGQMDILKDSSVDIFFIALHGRFGEDGDLQDIMDKNSLLYTGSGPGASMAAFNKIRARDLFQRAGLRVPLASAAEKDRDIETAIRKMPNEIDKLVIKPACEGSSIGISITENREDAAEAARNVCRDHGTCLIEEFIEGREASCGVIES